MTEFTSDLAITLSFTLAGEVFAIPAQDIKSLELDLTLYGFKGNVSFIVSSEGQTDKLFTPFTTKNDLIELTLQVELFITATNTTSIPLVLNGLVTTRHFSEQTLTNILPSQALMLNRHYHLTFADPAQVLWTQHFPCVLQVDSDLKTLIKAHTSEKINLTCDWPVLEVVYPVLSLSLGAGNTHASFYDFLIWLVDSQGGVFSYDIAKNKYSLTASKLPAGKPQSLDPFEIDQFSVKFPEVLRFQPNVLNAYSESPEITPVSNEQKATPLCHDYIERYPIAADMQSRVTLETSRFKQRSHEVEIKYKKFQLHVTPPGQAVDFKGTSAWNAALFVQANTYQVKKWQLQATWIKQGDVPGYSCYEITHSMQLENSTELWIDLPPYTPPVYPFYVEGKIVSEKGEEKETTYQFYTDDKTSVVYYKVSIPLWENKNIRASYQPNFDGGQFYFPPYKSARVLIGLNFNNAFIASFLDWGAGTALPLDSQGNQVVMGKSTTSQNIIRHTYVDSKPKLEIQRTEAKDTELLQFSDGYIILQTQLEEEESS